MLFISPTSLINTFLGRHLCDMRRCPVDFGGVYAIHLSQLYRICYLLQIRNR